MGSSSSKSNAADSASHSPSTLPSSSSSSSSSVRRNRSYRSRVFQSSCLGSHHDSGNVDPQVSEYQTEEDADGHCMNETKSVSNDGNDERYRKVKVQQPDDLNDVTTETEDDEWGQRRGGCMSSRVFSSRALNTSTHFLSRMNFFPGNVSFRLCRTNSLGSARPYLESSTRFAMSSNEGEQSPSESVDNSNPRTHGHDLFNTFFTNQPPRTQPEDIASDRLRQLTSAQGVVGDGVDAGVDCDGNSGSRNHAYNDGPEARLANRWIASGETVERNVQFSRTLSVGRLRDRVLRRSSFADVASSPFQQERDVRHASQASERQALDIGRGLTSSQVNISRSPASPTQSGPGSSMYGSHGYELETSRPREARYHDLLEYRSNFLERRRRIRSQVRALQRLGSRFENITGHERTCILSGQHRRGHCTCRASTRHTASSDETSARASISRIVMLAEALFEVLDEIHQQSVVLSSRPSMSSIGAVPAPNEVVESLPLRSYSKLQKQLHNEAAQCYICLVEYEEGDLLRTLPCHHEYHKACIDKWLKEIHRVCPLCRGDVCRPDSLPTDV